MSDLKAPRARPYGLTLFEAIVLLLLTVGGVLLIRHRMELAQETGIRGSAKAQLLEMGIHVVTAEDSKATGTPSRGTAVMIAPRLQEDVRRISKDEINLISFFKETTELNLDWGYAEDAGLFRLSHFKDLEVLSLACSLISDDGLSVLKNFPELRELNLRYSCVKGPGLRYLKLLPKLERLDLSDNELTDDCVSTLLELKALKKLALNGTFVSPARLDEFRSRGIELSEPSFPGGRQAGLPDGISLVFELPTLGSDPGMQATVDAWKIIQKTAYQADSQHEIMLPPDGRVTCVRVRGAKLRQEQLDAIAQISSLRNLDLAVSRFPEPAALTALNSLRELRRVDLSRTAAREVLLLDLGWMQQIESLHLCSAGLVDGDLRSLSVQCPDLRILDLSRNKLTDAVLPSLLKCGWLEELSLAGTGVTVEGILRLELLSNLRRLDLRGMSFSEKQLTLLKKERPQLRIVLDSSDG